MPGRIIVTLLIDPILVSGMAFGPVVHARAVLLAHTLVEVIIVGIVIVTCPLVDIVHAQDNVFRMFTIWGVRLDAVMEIKPIRVWPL